MNIEEKVLYLNQLNIMAGKYSINRDKVLLPTCTYIYLNILFYTWFGPWSWPLVIVACLVEETLESTIDKPILKLLVWLISYFSIVLMIAIKNVRISHYSLQNDTNACFTFSGQYYWNEKNYDNSRLIIYYFKITQ